jgi:hypothetical protein
MSSAPANGTPSTLHLVEMFRGGVGLLGFAIDLVGARRALGALGAPYPMKARTKEVNP